MNDDVYNIDIVLGKNASNYDKDQKNWALKAARFEVEAYIGRSIKEIASIGNEHIYSAVLDIAVIKLYRTGTEAVASQSFSGVSESFLSGYPTHITAMLNRYRKIKVIG